MKRKHTMRLISLLMLICAVIFAVTTVSALQANRVVYALEILNGTWLLLFGGAYLLLAMGLLVGSFFLKEN